MNGHSTRKDTQRIIELLEQGYAAGDRAENVMRRIVKQMPHVTFADIAQVATVHAEERQLDAGVQTARVEALKQIVSIIRETEQRSGNARLTMGETCMLLMIRAQADGDKRAAELLDELNKAALVVSLGE